MYATTGLNIGMSFTLTILLTYAMYLLDNCCLAYLCVTVNVPLPLIYIYKNIYMSVFVELKTADKLPNRNKK